MKIDWRLGLLAAAAALGLQACDVQVHSDAGRTTVQQPQASLPEDTRLDGQQTAAATPPVAAPPAEAPPVDASVAAAPAPDAAASAAMPVPAPEATAQAPAQPDTSAQAPAQPDTSALGAGGATPPAASTATTSSPPAASTATTNAAPTELQRFFENNSPAAKAEKAAAKK